MSEISRLPQGQHEWEATFGTDDLGRPILPRHHRLMLWTVLRRPTNDEARLLEAGLQQLERVHPHGPEGILTTLGWSAHWFNEHSSIPGIIGFASKMARWEDPRIDPYHAVLHLAGDGEDVVAAAQERLEGHLRRSLPGVFSATHTRTGFVGDGLPSQRLPGLGIPRDAPLLMGFRSGLRGNQAPEDAITIESGPLAGGTTQHVSRILLDLDAWYALDHDARAGLMYAPSVSATEAETFAEDAPSDYRRYRESVSRHGRIGHAQSAARARVGNVPLINRRDFGSLDDGAPGTHFVSLQRELRDFNNTRAIMNGADAATVHHSVGQRHRNGINAFMKVTHRAAYAVPPRRLRSFPHLLSDTTP